VKTALIDMDKLAIKIAVNNHNSMTQEMMI
jgi:hypothetical protein